MIITQYRAKHLIGRQIDAGPVVWRDAATGAVAGETPTGDGYEVVRVVETSNERTDGR